MVSEQTPDALLQYLLSHAKESRNKIKATLQGRGIKVNGKVVTQFDAPLRKGDRIQVARHKNNSAFKSRYVKIVYEDRWIVVVERTSASSQWRQVTRR